jgi:hypothetical protein
VDALKLAVAEGLPSDKAVEIAKKQLGFTPELIALLRDNPVADAIAKLKESPAGTKLAPAKDRSRSSASPKLLPISVLEVGAVNNKWIKLGADLDNGAGDLDDVAARRLAYAAARKAFEQVKPETKEDFADAKSRIGLTYHHEARDLLAQGKKAAADALEKKALDLYRTAFRLNGKDDSPLYNVACSQISRGHLGRALATLAFSVKVAQRNADLESIGGTLKLLKKDVDLQPLRDKKRSELDALIELCTRLAPPEKAA